MSQYHFPIPFRSVRLGVIAKLRKATISVMFVCLSIRMELGPDYTDFREIWLLEHSSKIYPKNSILFQIRQ